MRILPLTACLILLTLGASPAVEMAPEDAILLNVRALKECNLGLVLESMPEAERAIVEEQWAQFQQRELPPLQVGEANAQLAMLQQPGAAEVLMALVEPSLTQFNPEAAAAQLGMAAMMVPMVTAQLLGNAPEAQQLNMAMMQVIPGMQQWVRTAGLDSPDKARVALGILTGWFQAQDFKTVADLQGRSLDEIIDLANSATRMGKDLVAVYGVDIDAWLDSITASSTPGETDGEATLSLAMTCAGKPLALTLDMKRTADGRWELASAEQIREQVEALQRQQQGGMGEVPLQDEPDTETAPF